MKTYSDAELEGKIAKLQQAIESWARKNEVWLDSGFQTHMERTDAEPSSPAVVTVLYSDGPLHEVLDGSSYDDLQTEFYEFVSELGYECENQDGVSFYFYVEENDALNQAFEEYFHWKWISTLVQPDIADLYEEMYSHFRRRPEDLYKLGPREFEIILFRIFQTQGFEAVLGPGKGDGGVDIRLLHRDPLGDVLTLVQAKRNAPHRKIGLGPVQALRGAMAAEDIGNGIVVSTSDYLPGAKRFANNCRAQLELKTSNDVAEWCEAAERKVIKDKSSLIERDRVNEMISDLALRLDKRLVHASTGYTMQTNAFALIVKETKYAALLMNLPRKNVQDDGYGQMGTEIPILNSQTIDYLTELHVRRVKINIDEQGRPSYWDGKNLYFPWDGKPKSFSYLD